MGRWEGLKDWQMEDGQMGGVKGWADWRELMDGKMKKRSADWRGLR